jgi:hypothetical protein
MRLHFTSDLFGGLVMGRYQVWFLAVCATISFAACDIPFLTKRADDGKKTAIPTPAYDESSVEQIADLIEKDRDGRVEAANGFITSECAAGKLGCFDAVVKSNEYFVPPYDSQVGDRDELPSEFARLVFAPGAGVPAKYPVKLIELIHTLDANTVDDQSGTIHGQDFLTQISQVILLKSTTRHKSFDTDQVPCVIAAGDKAQARFGFVKDFKMNLERTQGYTRAIDQNVSLLGFAGALSGESLDLDSPFPFKELSQNVSFVPVLEQKSKLGLDVLKLAMTTETADPNESIPLGIQTYDVAEPGTYCLGAAWQEWTGVEIILQRQLKLKDASADVQKAIAANKPAYLDYFNEAKGGTDRYQFSFAKLSQKNLTDRAIVEKTLSIPIGESDLPTVEGAKFLRLNDQKLLKAIIKIPGKPRLEVTRLKN